MTAYAWPTAYKPAQFELRVQPNQRVFASAFNAAALQVVDLGGDYWTCSMAVPFGNSDAAGAVLEAFVNRLRGSVNTASIYHFKRPLPRGTMRSGSAAAWNTSVPSAATWSTASAATATWTAGTPCVRDAVAQFATSCVLRMLPGYTLEPGDLFAFSTGQTVQYVGSSTLTADGSGDMTVEFSPSVRSALTAYSAITYDRPTINFRLRDGTPPPVQWVPGGYQSVTLDFVEAV